MALPQTREDTAVDGANVKPSTINAIQDAIIANHNGVHTDRTLYIPASVAQPTFIDSNPAHFFSVDEISAFGSWVSNNNVGRRVDFPILLPAGERIKSITVFLFEDDTDMIECEFWEFDPSNGTKTQKGGDKNSGTTDTYATVGWTDADADFPLAMAADKQYVVMVSLPSTMSIGDARVMGISVVYDHP